MSKLTELLAELCPDGVEYKTLSELFHTRNGYTPSKANREFWENGTVPWFRMEDIRENGRILSQATQSVSLKAVKGDLFPADSIIVATSATIGEHALITVPSLANQRFTYLVLKDEYRTAFNIKFLFYYCFKLDEYCKACVNQGNFASVDMQKFPKFRFPLPPLPVQSEIVRILDNFTKIADELTLQLTEELTARKKQHDYYRDKLLNFSVSKNDYKWMMLRNVANVFRGEYITKKSTKSGKVPVILGGQEPAYYIDKSNHDGEIVVVARSGVSAGFVSYWNEPIFITDGFGYEAKAELITPKYLYYALKNMEGVLNSMKRGAGVPHVSGAALGQVLLPVPPLPVQARIVSTLDHFNVLYNDLTSALPAEIEARRKQYEYYRDKLLTFKEKKE